MSNDLLASMLQTTKPERKTIEIIGDDAVTDSEVSTKNEGIGGISNEDPTMLELMMMDQAEAQKLKAISLEQERAKDFKKPLSGFTKGFLSKAQESKNTKKIIPNKEDIFRQRVPVLESKNPAKSDEIPTIVQRKEERNLVLSDVQQAMGDDENPLLQHLKSGAWMTEDLMNTFKANAVLADGFTSRKCVAALELMQQDPQAAKQRFANDAEVTRFLQQFGRVMAHHFATLEKNKNRNSNESHTNNSNISKITEINASTIAHNNRVISSSGSSSGSSSDKVIGPLHAQALSVQQLNKNSIVKESSTDIDEKRVQEVLQNSELREMLLDPQLQQILRECQEPVKFRQYMSDPVISTKIKKLYAAGLVGTLV